MATVQWNALSTNLFGSFEALTILPDAAMMGQERRRYPVLYLIHDNGENAMQFMGMPELERLCNEKRMIICCPWIFHSFGHDLRWGGKFGTFAAEEFPGICGNMFPVDRENAMIGGTGWGAYAACIMAADRPGAFRKVIAFNGKYDAAGMCRRISEGGEEETLTVPMLEAAFGEPDKVAGSAKDLFAREAPEGVILGIEAGFDGEEETRRLAEAWKKDVLEGSLAKMIAEAL